MILFWILIISTLLLLSALFSATETAITASSPGKIQKIKQEGDKRIYNVLKLLKSKEKVISTMLIGNTLINIVCTTIATSLFIGILGDDIGPMVSSIVMSFMIIIFAEVVPKAIAVAQAEKIVLFTSSFTLFFLKILKPINTLLAVAVNIFCFILKINLKPEISGAEEVRGVIEHHHQEGNVYKTDRDMLGGVLDIKYMTISEIMVHRSNIFAINADLPINEIVKSVLTSNHSRIPLWKDSKDNITGILHIRDLLATLHKNNNDPRKINLENLVIQPWFVPDNALVSRQLHAFLERKNHLACVVDEYGDLQGIITLEDILEEIVGQIQDEHDPSNIMINKKSENEFIIDGLITIRDLNRELNWNLPDTDANTIAGLIIHQMERIPHQGENLEIFNLNITILKKVANRIKTIKIKVLPEFDTANSMEFK